jgi:hypothetical protein
MVSFSCFLAQNRTLRFGFQIVCTVQGENNLQRLRESEVVHGRWAMLGVAGCLFVEVLGLGNWYDAPLWAVNGGTATYFGIPVPLDIKTVILLELILMAGVEIQRNEEPDPEKRVYPGAQISPVPHCCKVS